MHSQHNGQRSSLEVVSIFILCIGIIMIPYLSGQEGEVIMIPYLSHYGLIFVRTGGGQALWPHICQDTMGQSLCHYDPTFVRTGGGNQWWPPICQDRRGQSLWSADHVIFMPPLQLGRDKATVIHKVPCVCDTKIHWKVVTITIVKVE